MPKRIDTQTARPAVGPTSEPTAEPSSERPPHLARLDHVWIKRPIYFITSCTQGREPLLANDTVHEVLRAEWQTSEIRHGWRIGRYVIMPDHVHFFCAALPEAKPLSAFMQRWKEWTGKSVLSALRRPAPLWQPRFFDHVLRTPESYAEKWSYVSQNPVRAGLSATPEAWPHAGHIHFDSPM
ncbi:MAG: transposase [Opitutaceae bacterium]|jgi:REP element-mobilizing transposase RayT